ncbi:zinc finger protein 862-like [Saccostrea echinata]|uniref:zinc finger protein 862-like n=1 Tax=Saccostrea echinata TaxID=191078 RepID=UPI002A820A18|nr:zinc finger protein 862-like [Saccostrea echinata]
MPPKKMIKLLPNQGKLTEFLRKEKSGSESDINNNKEVNDERDADLEAELNESGDRETEKTRKIRKFQKKWLTMYSWLRLENEDDSDEFMYCNACTDHKKVNGMNKVAKNKNFQHSTLTRHVNLADHKLAILAPCLKENMDQCQKKHTTKYDDAIKSLLTCVNWMVSENLPLSKFKSLIDLLNELSLENIAILKSFCNINYESEFSASELLDSLSKVADTHLNESLSASPMVTVMSDESTDISNTKRLVIYAQLISDDMKPSTHYVNNMECTDATGKGIAVSLLDEFKQRGVPASKIMSMGSDGASAMTGKQNGAAAIMQRQNPHMVNVHCVAHRLALCTSQAASKNSHLQAHQQILTDLFYYFKGSSKRQSKLKEIQNILDDPCLTIKEINSVRWLSYFSALSTVQRTVDSLLTYLAEADGNKDAKAAGLRKKIASESFISITYMMMDAMAPVTILSQFFQTENVDLALVKVKIDLCLSDLEKIKSMGSPHLQAVKEEMDVQTGFFQGHSIKKTNLNLNNLTADFIDALKENIIASILALRPISFLSNEELINFGEEEINTLCKFHGERRTVEWSDEKGNHKNSSEAVISAEKTKEEWNFLKRVVLAEHYPRDCFWKLWNLIVTYHKEQFPNLIVLAQLALTSAVHTAGCERGFSMQNQILTKL